MTATRRAAPYQVVVLGEVGTLGATLQQEVKSRLADLGLPSNTIGFLDERNAASRDRANPVMGVFCGGASATTDTALVTDLLEDSVVIAPLVSNPVHVHAELPPQLRHINALSLSPAVGGLGRLTTLILEIFRLLRSRRRLFISYKRTGSQPLAERLYEALDARGFDVFIDTRSVPPAADFQSELWHRMADSDVIILIDTPGFREGRWTAAELAQANATRVQILHLLWPRQQEDATSAFSHFLKLTHADFVTWWPGRGRWMRQHTLRLICDEAERLRARALAARYTGLVDNLCDAARDQGLKPIVQLDGWIKIVLPSGETLAVVPTVGIPTSDRINDISDDIARASETIDLIWVVYDQQGILKRWLAHLTWLDQHLPLRSVSIKDAPFRLQELSR